MFGYKALIKQYEARIEDLKAQIEDLKKLAFPPTTPSLAVESILREQDAVLSGGDSRILSPEEEAIISERDRLLSGNY